MCPSSNEPCLISSSQEFFKDPKTGKLNIIVSLSTGSYGPFLPYAFTATDSTLKTWSGPVVLSGISNAGLGYIDSFPVYYKYVSGYKSSQDIKLVLSNIATNITSSQRLKQRERRMSSTLLLLPSQDPIASSRQGTLQDGARPKVLLSLSFPTESSVCEYLKCYLSTPCWFSYQFSVRYADGFNTGKYIYSDSSDLYTWSAYQTLPNGLSGFVRHGTVLKQ